MYFKNLKRIIFIFVLLLFVPMIVNAAAPGVRSYETGNFSFNTNNPFHNNVFLGGNYLELGINDTGSFYSNELDPSVIPPTAKKFHIDNKNGARLGLIYSESGFGQGGQNETAAIEYAASDGDYWWISYKKGDQYYVRGSSSTSWYIHAVEPDPEISTGKMFKSMIVKDETSLAGHPQAKITAETAEGVQIEMIISFGENDKYFITDVNVSNLSTDLIEDVRFYKMQLVAPEYVINNTSESYTKIISNADESKPGGENNLSMVIARGPYYYNSFFYASFDSNSKVNVLFGEPDFEDFDDNPLTPISFVNKFWKATPNVSTKVTNDDLAFMYGNVTTNGYVLSDEAAITLSSKLGNLAAKTTTETANASTVFYTSLDNDAISGINSILESRNSIVKKRTDKSIEVNTTSGYEYSIDGENWNTTGVFTGLTANTEYTIQERNASSHTGLESFKVTTKKTGKAAVALKTVVVSEDSITIKGDNGYEYSIDNGGTWQSSETFNGLTPDTEYTFVGRLEESYEEMYGETSEPLKVKTLKNIESGLSTSGVKIDVEIIDAVQTIKFSKGLLYEGIKNDETLNELINEGGHELRVVFDIVQIQPVEDDLKHLDGKTLAFTFDIEIKLYSDGNFVKNIEELDKELEMTISIPDTQVKEGRKFYVVRKHEQKEATTDEHGHTTITVVSSKWDTLEDKDEDDTTITISNGLFSEFYVAYEDSKDEASNPKTTDEILSYILILGLSVSGLYLYKKLES